MDITPLSLDPSILPTEKLFNEDAYLREAEAIRRSKLELLRHPLKCGMARKSADLV